MSDEPAVTEPEASAVPGVSPGRDAVPQEVPPGPGIARSVRETKGWRKDLDLILQKMKRSQQPGSRERALAGTKIQETMMWLGMDLKELAGGVSCYPHGNDPESPLVDPVPDGLQM